MTNLVQFRRSYLVSPNTWETLKVKHAENLHHDHKWTESFYDTKSSSLSQAECILTKDTDSPNYWKFFCFARDNIMELTTDEQDINEPLSRIKNFRSTDKITSQMLQPFFNIDYQRQEYKFEHFKIRLTKSDYGFAFCTLLRDNVPPTELPQILDEADRLAKLLDLHSLARYEPKKFL